MIIVFRLQSVTLALDKYLIPLHGTTLSDHIGVGLMNVEDDVAYGCVSNEKYPHFSYNNIGYVSFDFTNQ